MIKKKNGQPRAWQSKEENPYLIKKAESKMKAQLRQEEADKKKAEREKNRCSNCNAPLLDSSNSATEMCHFDNKTGEWQ